MVNRKQLYNFDNIIFHIRLLFNFWRGDSSGALMHDWNLYKDKPHLFPGVLVGRKDGKSLDLECTS